MPRLVGVHHTSFTVADIDRSVAFFRDVLGLEVLHVREVRDEYFSRIVGLPDCLVRAALLRLPGENHCLELFQYLNPIPRLANEAPPRPCDPGSGHLSFLVDDLPGYFEQLQNRGVNFVSQPVRITAGPNLGGYGLYLRDPNGILIELFQPPRREPS
jgi:catechol 2,3-dioxygenase-like lactoylglutathione lyase family enzyme